MLARCRSRNSAPPLACRARRSAAPAGRRQRCLPNVCNRSSSSAVRDFSDPTSIDPPGAPSSRARRGSSRPGGAPTAGLAAPCGQRRAQLALAGLHTAGLRRRPFVVVAQQVQPRARVRVRAWGGTSASPRNDKKHLSKSGGFSSSGRGFASGMPSVALGPFPQGAAPAFRSSLLFSGRGEATVI